MKIVSFLLISVLAMAEISVPYPYPDYDEDLIAKEIVNGTYIASIDMMIKNRQTGEERYVHVPDSRVETRLISNDNTALREQDIDVTMTREDRDKLSERAVLPKKVTVVEDLPTIISHAMCPQGLEFVKDEYFGLIKTSSTKHFTIYDDGVDKALILYKKRTDENGDIVSDVYKYDGDSLSLMFTMPKVQNIADDTQMIQLNIVSFFKVGNRHYIGSLNHIVEYSLNGVVDITYLGDTQLYGNEIGVIDSNGNRYIVDAIPVGLQVINIDTLSTSIQMQQLRYSSLVAINKSIVDDSYFRIENNLLNLKDGVVSLVDTVKNSRPTLELYAVKKSRFDYYANAEFALGVNIKRGIVAPKIQEKLDTEDVEMFIGTMIVDSGIADIVRHIAYSPNYVNIVDTGIEADTLLTFNDEFAYFQKDENVIVMKITKWAYKIPRAEFAEQFAKEGMLDAIWWKSNTKPNIGGD